jgi:hypothetical protein
MTAHQAHHFEVPVWDAVALMTSQNVGRLCVIHQGVPLAVPVSYQLDGDTAGRRVVVRTSPTSLLGGYEGPASFEVDHIDEERGRAWSVIARGTLRHSHGDPSLPDPHPWIGDGRHLWLVLDIDSLTARRFSVTPDADGFAVEWSMDAV